MSVKITRLSRKSEELDLRNELIYNDVDELLYTGDIESDSLKLYSKDIIVVNPKIVFDGDKFEKEKAKNFLILE